MSSLIHNKADHHLSEKLQNKIRLVIGACLLGMYLWLGHEPIISSFSNPAVITMAGYIIFSLLIAISVWIQPYASKNRQSLALFADISATALLLIFGGKYAAPLCIAYYILILSHGLNGQTRDFRICTSLSIIGFSFVLYFGDFWRSQTNLGMGLLFGMVVMAILITRHTNKKETDTDTIGHELISQVDYQQQTQNTAMHEEHKVLLITHDTLDRHMILSYINSWKIPLTVCDNTVRACAEIINAEEKGIGYTSVIVDSLNLDMDPIQFSKSLKFDNKLGDISLIYISPEQHQEQETQLLAAGYSKLISLPLDKTILYDAIHTTAPEQHGDSRITRLISRYSSKKSSTQPSDILLAIGNPIEQTLFRTILEKNGQRVYSVSSGSQALDALNTHQFDMVIIDLNMSDIDGKDVIRLYYYTYLNQEWVPFIALIDEATPSALAQCREAEVDAIMVRPVSEQKLLMTVADIAASNKKQAENINIQWRPTLRHNTLTADKSDLIINTHTLRQLENLSSDSAFLDSMISNFFEDMSKSLSGLQHAIDNLRFTEFQDFAHALRDTSSNLGAISLHRLSLMALQINQNEFQQQGKLLLNELNLALSKTMHALHEYVINCDNAATKKE